MRGAWRGREELGAGAAPSGGEVVPQRVVVEVEGLNRMEDVVQPLVETVDSGRLVEAARVDASMADPGRVEDVPQTRLEETAVAPPVRPEEEGIGSGDAEGATQVRMGEGLPPPPTVAVNVPVPGMTEGGDAGNIRLTVA